MPDPRDAAALGEATEGGATDLAADQVQGNPSPFDLAARGWHVFPLKPRSKHPATPNGFKDATDDLEIVASWFAGTDYNVGIATGASRLLVVDVDDAETFTRWLAGRAMPATFTVATGKGRHYYFAAPADREIRSSQNPGCGYDIRSAGGYVVGPGSTHPDGRRYAVVDASPVDDLPGWLSEELAASAAGSGWTAPDIAALRRDGIPPGGQDATLANVVFVGRRDGRSLREIRSTWWEIVRRSEQSREPWTEDDLARHVDSADRKLRLGTAASIEAPERLAAATTAVRAGDRAGLPELVSLPDLLAEPDESVEYLVDRLLPTGARAVLAAQFKAGKTTCRDNLVRSLADAVPFLGEFETNPLPDGRTVVVIDNEMTRAKVRRWLADQGIEHPERVQVVVLRGKVATFDLLTPAVRAAWAMKLRAAAAAVVVFDCLRPVLDALGLDESHDAGRFLVAFDALLAEAGVTEAVVVHHMGHAGERSRGDSRIRDWPDVEWRLVREQPEAGEEPNPAAPRYFSAYGRDVDVPESALTFDPSTHHLTLAGGNRRDAKARAALPDVMAVLEAAGEPLSGNRIEQRLAGADHSRKAVRASLKYAIREGLVLTEPGDRNAVLHRLNPSSPPVRGSSPPVRRRGRVQFASSPIGGELNSTPETAENPDLATGELNRGVCEVCGLTGRPLDAASICDRDDHDHDLGRRTLGVA